MKRFIQKKMLQRHLLGPPAWQSHKCVWRVLRRRTPLGKCLGIYPGFQHRNNRRCKWQHGRCMRSWGNKMIIWWCIAWYPWTAQLSPCLPWLPCLMPVLELPGSRKCHPPTVPTTAILDLILSWMRLIMTVPSHVWHLYHYRGHHRLSGFKKQTPQARL